MHCPRRSVIRDISPNNILIKKYDDATIIKVSDFGLVKTPSSELTSTNTDFKGWFNDPALRTEGFSNYGLLHETYALALVVYFVLTGRTNVVNVKETQIKEFIEKGTNADKSKRFQSIKEILRAVDAI
jgi:serine/threonine-protein kinase